MEISRRSFLRGAVTIAAVAALPPKMPLGAKSILPGDGGHSTITVSIPSDKPTLQAALDAYSTRAVKQGVRINLHVETGHALLAGLSVANGDYSRFMVTSTDAEVLLDPAFPTTDAVLRVGIDARGPTWDILVNCNSQAVGSAESVPAAMIVEGNSSLNLGDGAGAKNTGGGAAGLFVFLNSLVTGVRNDFSGCAGYSVLLSQVADAILSHGDFRNSSHADAAVYVSRGCRFSAVASDFSGATGAGLRVRRSYALIIPNDSASTRFDGCGGYAIQALQGSTVIAHHRAVPVTISNCGGGIEADGAGTTVDFRLGTIANVTADAFLVSRDAEVNAQDVTATGVGGKVINAGGAGTSVHARGLSAPSAAGGGILASQGAIVSGHQADLSLNGGIAVDAHSGANVSVAGADLGGSVMGIRVHGGGIVTASGATYDDASQTENVVTGEGIIFNNTKDYYPLRGTNANGTFVKHADGTMVCSHYVKAEFNSASRLRASWTLPAAFVAADYSFSAAPSYVSPAGVREGIAPAKLATSMIVRDSHTASSLIINVDSFASSPFVSGDFIWLSLMATGRWK